MGRGICSGMNGVQSNLVPTADAAKLADGITGSCRASFHATVPPPVKTLRSGGAHSTRCGTALSAILSQGALFHHRELCHCILLVATITVPGAVLRCQTGGTPSSALASAAVSAPFGAAVSS